jgi:gluconolactonase
VSAGGSAGGAITTGGTSASNAASAGAGATNARGSGICSAGSYAAPDLTAVPQLVSSSAASGQYEGALWLEAQAILLFSGMDTNATGVVPATVGRLTPPNTIDVNLIADSGTNGLAVDFSGNVLAGSQKVQGIVSIDVKTKTLTTLVNTDASGHHFNSVNDLTVRTDGTIYFTDPDYQLGGRSSETGVKGVYRLSPTKAVTLVDGQFNQPNGISLSPDEAVLYVSDTAANKIRKFNVATDGSLSGKADFASVTSPDGGAVDCAGNLYWALNATPGKVVVLASDGRLLGTIAVGSADKPTNVAFGGLDHKTLYVTTSPRKIYSMAMNIPGFPY